MRRVSICVQRQAHKEHHSYHLKLAEDISACLDDEETELASNMLKKINRIF